MGNFLVVLLILAILGGAGWYIYKEKKQGKKCIGCPDSGSCSGACSSCKGCHKG